MREASLPFSPYLHILPHISPHLPTYLEAQMREASSGLQARLSSRHVLSYTPLHLSDVCTRSVHCDLTTLSLCSIWRRGERWGDMERYGEITTLSLCSI